MSNEETDVDMPTKTATSVRMPCPAWAYDENGKRQYCKYYLAGMVSTANHDGPHSEDGIDLAEYQMRLSAWRNSQA